INWFEFPARASQSTSVLHSGAGQSPSSVNWDWSEWWRSAWRGGTQQRHKLCKSIVTLSALRMVCFPLQITAPHTGLAYFLRGYCVDVNISGNSAGF
ncbi:hypothetical protein AMECASPLE_009004, partial [Ameca splendens]